MPISPKEAKEFKSIITEELLDSIDKILLKNSGDFTHKVRAIMLGSISPSDKEKLESLYLQAGWEDVVIKNSDENGEPAGLWSIECYY